jgi:hypothetical protein
MKSYTLMENGKVEEQTNSLFLYHYFTYKEKMISYGKLKANEEFTKEQNQIFPFLPRPSYQFINQYILRLGVLDGKRGLLFVI